MAQLRVATTVPAQPAAVWADLSDIASHVEWMRDADEIRFTSSQRDGVGTTFECDTTVGPFHLTDRMEVTRWDPGKAMGVRHTGIVAGDGMFTLRPEGEDRTCFEWVEQLTFPIWMAGRLGARASVPVLTAVWRGSLRNLAARFE